MTVPTLRSWVVAGALAAGAAVGAAAVANAATGGSSAGNGQVSPPSFMAGGVPARPPGPGPAAAGHGPGETLLTGSSASKAKAAALAAVPGATVLRVETDSGPAAYEAHLRTSDGSLVTVKLDGSFHVKAVQDGMGAGPGGPPPAGAPSGAPPGPA